MLSTTVCHVLQFAGGLVLSTDQPGVCAGEEFDELLSHAGIFSKISTRCWLRWFTAITSLRNCSRNARHCVRLLLLFNALSMMFKRTPLKPVFELKNALNPSCVLGTKNTPGLQLGAVCAEGCWAGLSWISVCAAAWFKKIRRGKEEVIFAHLNIQKFHDEILSLLISSNWNEWLTLLWWSSTLFYCISCSA